MSLGGARDSGHPSVRRPIWCVHLDAAGRFKHARPNTRTDPYGDPILIAWSLVHWQSLDPDAVAQFLVPEGTDASLQGAFMRVCGLDASATIGRPDATPEERDVPSTQLRRP